MYIALSKWLPDQEYALTIFIEFKKKKILRIMPIAAYIYYIHYFSIRMPQKMRESAISEWHLLSTHNYFCFY